MSKRKLRISSEIALPLEAVTETFAIIAKRGVGKTHTAVVMAEEMLDAGAQVVIVDPVGVWWGLRSSADGKKAGLPIAVLGGDHGDLPLDEKAGELVADVVVDQGLSVVLDLSHLRKGPRAHFMTDFAERLFHRNRDPLHLVLDEADEFAPQRPVKGRERLLGAVEDLVRRGRAKGIGVTLITQRSAVLNKDVLTQAEVLVCLRTIGPQDVDAVDAWIKHHGDREKRKKVLADLASLEVGTAWVWSPGWLDVFRKVRIRQRKTFDSSATPKTGRRTVKAPRKRAEIDLGALEAHLAEAVEEARASDPKALRRELNQLKRELKKARTAAHREPETKIEVERVEVPVLKGQQLRRMEGAVNRFAKASADVCNLAGELQEALAQAANGASAPSPSPPVRDSAPRTRSKKRHAASVATPEPPAGMPADDELDDNLVRGERKILETLARRYPVGVTRTQLGTLSGYTASGGTFGKYYGRLKKLGFLVEAPKGILITHQGVDYLGIDEPRAPQSTEEVLAMWKDSLVAGERKMLDELVRIHPETISRDELGERTGYTASGGTFGKYLGTLKRNGLVEDESGELRASETLFLVEV